MVTTPTEYRSRAVRSLVELHASELRDFLVVWKRFAASGRPMPEAHGDPDYESAERLVSHVQGAARGYLVWIGESLGRPFPGVERVREPERILPRLEDFMEETLAAWATHLAGVEDADLAPQAYTTRWGDSFTVDQMLEHAVVHPMRHRIQLERILTA
jgi:hypothetical protein